jgi:hypothetical protein
MIPAAEGAAPGSRPPFVVYAETNFVLEIALLQKEHASCTSLLELAAARPEELQLAFPTFCVGEVYEAFERKRRIRRDLADGVRREFDQLARSEPHAAIRRELVNLFDAFGRINEDQQAGLDHALGNLLAVARLLPVARETARLRFSRDLTSQDALV